MKATEIKLEKQGFHFSARTPEARSHYKMLMSMGKNFPGNKAQAKFFIANTNQMDVLNADDVEAIESLMNRHGFEGEYKATKSGTWVRLQNFGDLKKAVKLEYY